MTVCLHASRWPGSPVVPEPESVVYRPVPGQIEGARHEASVLPRQLRQGAQGPGAEGRQGIPARFFVTVLVVLAAIMALASVVH